MKTASFWASTALLVSSALAETTTTSTASATSTSTAPSCTASLITTLCDYKKPGSAFAIASDGKPFCWQYCNAHPPCDFVIFNAANPNTGTGTCWVYPGQSFDESEGSSDCSNPDLSVYNKPVCSGGSATTTSGACTATASPSAVASGCGYPAPATCFSDCYASTGASSCLSLCSKADSCSYAIFNPHNSDNSQYASGTCWVYPNGTYTADSMSTCTGAAEQYVYDNPCPESSASSSSGSSSATGTSGGSETAKAAMDKTTSSAAVSTTTEKNSASVSLSFISPLPFGLTVLLLQAL